MTRDLEYYGQQVHRQPHQHLGFGVGTHFCLGNALVDLTDAELSPTSTVRGWESMPGIVGV